MTFAEKLNQAKQSYPFMRWREAVEFGLEQYTEENCLRMQKIFDDLIATLIEKGEDASEEEKVELFRIAIIATNEMNDEFDGSFIETGEREDLWELTNIITVAAGLNPKDYGEGEGLVSEWREW